MVSMYNRWSQGRNLSFLATAVSHIDYGIISRNFMLEKSNAHRLEVIKRIRIKARCLLGMVYTLKKKQWRNKCNLTNSQEAEKGIS